MRNVLFPLLAKGPVFGGGGGGGGGGSDSGGGVSVTASSKGSSGGGYTSIKDLFDGGGPGQSGDTFGGLFGGISNTIGATPIGSGGGGDDSPPPPPPPPPPPAAAPPPPPADTGGYTSLIDLFDGGGPGQSGDTFGGLLGGVSNTIGLTPVASGPLSGGVYEGPNVDGTAGYLQDPGLMTVDPGTGFITSDENVFRPAPPAPILPPIMAPPSEPPPPPPPVAPAPVAPPVPARVEPPPISMGFLPPQIAQVGMDAVMGGASMPMSQPMPFVPRPVPPAPVPMPMPVSDQFGMPLALSAPDVRVPQLAQFFQPPAPLYTPASPVVDRLPVDPRPISGVTPLPGPTLDPKGGASGAIPPGGIATLAAPAARLGLFGDASAGPGLSPGLRMPPEMRGTRI